MSSYFSLPSFARAKKNKEALEKTNPTEPVLNEEDEEFLTKITSHGEPEEVGALEGVAPVVITDEGKEVEVGKDANLEAVGDVDQVAVPAVRPEENQAAGAESTDAAQLREPDSKTEAVTTSDDAAPATTDTHAEPTAQAEDLPEVLPEYSSTQKPAVTRKKSKRNKGLDLPSQEEAEAATKGFNYPEAQSSQEGETQAQGDKRTWASYLPTIRKVGIESTTAESKEGKDTEKATEAEDSMTRSWAQYASSIIPPMSSIPSLPASIPSFPASWTKSKDPEASNTPVYNPDGSIDQKATAEKQEKEVSVLLDNLSLSSINNRVFSFSAESQKYYDRFTQVLKDVIAGGPTAYEDMDKLMKEAGPTLEAKFKSMPPFVQTLVKSLPAKLGPGLGMAPELLATMGSEKPDDSLGTKVAAASKGDGKVTAEGSGSMGEKKKKSKRKIPGLKSLVSGQGVVASMLRNIVTFLRVRFPFLMGTTNVVMSLAVFILMFVFWYCHKRGKEVRLEREAAAIKAGDGAAEVNEDDDVIEVSDSEDEDVDEKLDGEIERMAQDIEKKSATGERKQKILNASEPKDVLLPEGGDGEKSESRD